MPVKIDREREGRHSETVKRMSARSEYDPNAAQLVLLARSRGILSTCHLRTGLLRGNERGAERADRPSREEEKRSARGTGGMEERQPSNILRDRTDPRTAIDGCINNRALCNSGRVKPGE